MAIVRWNPAREQWSELRRMQEEMDRVFRSFLNTDEQWKGATALFPALNLSTDEKSVTLRCELPGVAPDKVDLSITKDTLTLKGERDVAKPLGEVSYHRRERRGGTFNRTVTLPFEVEPEKARASFKNGILEVSVERAQRTMPRQITIKTT